MKPQLVQLVLALSVSFSTIVASGPALADWAPGAQNQLATIDKDYKDMGTGEFTTAWGGWKRMRLMGPKLRGRMISVTTKETKRGDVQVFLSPAESKVPRPFVIYFPGIFGETGDSITDAFAAKLEALDVHVLVVPNFLAENWLKAQPIYDRHPAKTELIILDAIWKEVLKRVPPTSMSRVHVVGESLGSIMATAWVGVEDWNPRPRNLTLLWPPVELDRALDNLDIYVENSRKEECSPVLTMPLFIRYLAMPAKPTGISERSGKCIAAWGAEKGFMKHLNNLSDVMNDLRGGRAMRPKSFKQFFQVFHEPFWRLIEAKDEMMNLGFLLKKVTPQKFMDVRILSSYDDFLNKGQPILEVGRLSGVVRENMVVFNWGGHGGPIATKEFDEFMRLEFGDDKDEGQ